MQAAAELEKEKARGAESGSLLMQAAAELEKEKELRATAGAELAAREELLRKTKSASHESILQTWTDLKTLGLLSSR